jgi:hypothetical protein
MQQEDWLLRQINQLSRVLGKILADLLGLKNQGRAGEGIEAAQVALKSELDLDIDGLLSIPKELLIKTLIEEKKFSDENLDNLAGIFFLISEELEQRGNDPERMKKFYGRALIIFEYLDHRGSTYSFDRRLKIEKIRSTLQSE